MDTVPHPAVCAPDTSDQDHPHLRKYPSHLHVYLLHGVGYPFIRGCMAHCLQKQSQQTTTPHPQPPSIPQALQLSENCDQQPEHLELHLHGAGCVRRRRTSGSRSLATLAPLPCPCSPSVSSAVPGGDMGARWTGLMTSVDRGWWVWASCLAMTGALIAAAPRSQSRSRTGWLGRDSKHKGVQGLMRGVGYLATLPTRHKRSLWEQRKARHKGKPKTPGNTVSLSYLLVPMRRTHTCLCKESSKRKPESEKHK